MATKPNRNIKVSQATIDKIKKQGMTASLKSASSNNSPEYREALRRMYGDARVAKATASTKPSSSGRYVGSMFVPDKPAKKTSGGGKYVGSMFVPDKPKAKSDGGGKYVGSMFVSNKPATKAPVKKAAASKPKEYKYGGFSMAGELLSRAYAKTPKAQRDARNKAKLRAEKNKNK